MDKKQRKANQKLQQAQELCGKFTSESEFTFRGKGT